MHARQPADGVFLSLNLTARATILGNGDCLSPFCYELQLEWSSISSVRPTEGCRADLSDGEDVKTVQELLRHANSRITLDVYTQAVNSHKRAAQSKVVQMIVPSVGTIVGTKRDQTKTGTEA